MIMDGDVPIDLFKLSFRGTGNKLSKIIQNHIRNVEILYVVYYILSICIYK